MMNELMLHEAGFLIYAIGITVWAIQGRIEIKRQREESRKALRGHCEEVVGDDKNI